MFTEHDANRALAERAAQRKALAEALRGRNRAHASKKRALKSKRINNASLWAMLNVGV